MHKNSQDEGQRDELFQDHFDAFAENYEIIAGQALKLNQEFDDWFTEYCKVVYKSLLPADGHGAGDALAAGEDAKEKAKEAKAVFAESLKLCACPKK